LKFGNAESREGLGDLRSAEHPRKFLRLEGAPGSPKTHRLWGGAIADKQGASEDQKFAAKPHRGPQKRIVFGVGRRQKTIFLS